MKDQKKYLASVKNLHVVALLDGTYRFVTQKEAEDKLKYFKEEYIISRHKLPEPLEMPHIILWIRDYDVTEDQKKAHYAGNFALVSIVKLEDGTYTLGHMKLPTELDHHPTRVRPPQPHPSWNYPFLRDVKNKKTYSTPDEVQELYQKIGMEFPKAVIPCTNKCYVMVYDAKAKPPVQKIVLITEALKEGGFIVTWQPNNGRETPLPTEAPQQEAMGQFTSQVMLKQKK